MARVVLINMGLFILPFVIYAIIRAGGGKPDWQVNFWRDLPLLWLTGAGAVLVLGMLVLFVQIGGDAPGGVYVPPAIKDGIVVPGHVDPKPAP